MKMWNTPEIETFWTYIASSVKHLLDCLEGLSPEDLNWRPMENANSLYVLANHTMGNIAENMLEVLGGQPVGRQREAEFVAQGRSPEFLNNIWQDLQERAVAALSQLSPEQLEQSYVHPRRGSMSGREVLIVAARHAAEHMGQAYLTRDLLLYSRGKKTPEKKY